MLKTLVYFQVKESDLKIEKDYDILKHKIWSISTHDWRTEKLFFH